MNLADQSFSANSLPNVACEQDYDELNRRQMLSTFGLEDSEIPECSVCICKDGIFNCNHIDAECLINLTSTRPLNDSKVETIYLHRDPPRFITAVKLGGGRVMRNKIKPPARSNIYILSTMVFALFMLILIVALLNNRLLKKRRQRRATELPSEQELRRLAK